MRANQRRVAASLFLKQERIYNQYRRIYNQYRRVELYVECCAAEFASEVKLGSSGHEEVGMSLLSALAAAPTLRSLSSRQWKRRRETVRLLPLAPRERAPLLFLTERIIEGDLVVPVYTQGTRRKAAGEPRSRERGNEFAASKGKSESSSRARFFNDFFFIFFFSPPPLFSFFSTSKAFTFRGLFGCSLKWNKDPGKYESVKAPMAERLRRSTRMV